MKTKEGNRSAIIKDAGIYAGASYVSTFLDAANGILLRNFINPAGMGVWALLQVILNYSRYITLGTGPALVREIPVYRGRGDEKKADEIKNSVFCFSMLTSVILSIGIILWAVFFRRSLSPEMLWGLMAIAVVLILQRCFNLYVVLLRAYRHFKMTSLIAVLSSAMTLFLTVSLVWKYGFFGLLAATILGYIATIWIIQKKNYFKFKIEFNRALLKDLSVFGLSLIAVNFAVTFLGSIDRIVIPKYLGFEALGYYSVAMMAQTYLTLTPTVMAVIVDPHMFEKLAESPDPAKIKAYVLEPAMAMSCIMPCMIMLSWISGPLVVRFLMPKYVPGIPALKILVFSSFFWGVTRSLMSYLILLKKHLELLPVLLIASLAAFLLSIFFIRGLGGNIEHVAIATVIAYVLYASGLMIVVARHLPKIRDLGLIITKIFGPFLYVVLVAFFLGDFFTLQGKSMGQCSVVFAAFCLFALPLLILVEKETRLLSHAKTIVLGKKNHAKGGSLGTDG